MKPFFKGGGASSHTERSKMVFNHKEQSSPILQSPSEAAASPSSRPVSYLTTVRWFITAVCTLCHVIAECIRTQHGQALVIGALKSLGGTSCICNNW